MFKMPLIERFKQAVDSASIGEIDDAERLYGYLYEQVKGLQGNVEVILNNCLGGCYYYIITNLQLSGHQGILALLWLLKKSNHLNEVAYTNYIYRPVHTAIQVGNNAVLLVLLADLRFNLCLTGNYHEPYGCLTPLQLALLYDNEQVARHLLSMENGLEILCAESSGKLDAIQFAEKIGKLNILRQCILESYPSVNQNSDELNNLMSRSNLVDSRCTNSDIQMDYVPSLSF